MSEASEVAFTISTAVLVHGGMTRGSTSGTVTSRKRCGAVSPMTSAASVVVRVRDWIPPRTISETWAVAKMLRATAAAVNELRPRPKAPEA